MFSFWCCVVAGSMWKMELGSEEPPAYPERHGRPDCAYYMRTGTCGFGDGCRYNHPRDRRMSTIAPSHQQYPVITSWEVARSSMLPPSYMQGPYGPMLLFPGIMPDPGWSTFPVTPSPPMSTGGEQNAVLEESQYDSAAQTSRLHPAHSESYPMAVSVSFFVETGWWGPQVERGGTRVTRSDTCSNKVQVVTFCFVFALCPLLNSREVGRRASASFNDKSPAGNGVSAADLLRPQAVVSFDDSVLFPSQSLGGGERRGLGKKSLSSNGTLIIDWNSESERNEDFEWDSDDEATTGDDAPSSDPPACPPGEVVLSSPWRSGPSNLALV
ncbi:hypothetical protein BHM03_00010970 [Ensete ventricosum]|nr:hypothetical protein BHM03_00010970 [Ensete ventricosum]